MRISDILTYGFPGAVWSISEISTETDAQNYARLVWVSPGTKPTLVEIQAQEAAATAAMAAFPKTLAKLIFADSNPDMQIVALAIRAFAVRALASDNTLRDLWTQFKAATAAATSLANLQTRVAALPNMPQRNKQQMWQAIRDDIDANGG